MRMLKAGDVIISKEQEDGIVSSMKGMASDITRLHVECEMLKRENTILRKDAERYRWLCDGNGYFLEEAGIAGHSNEKEDADKAIDEAMLRKAEIRFACLFIT